MTSPQLARRLGTRDAVVIGLGSMIGAGVFAAFGPAARAAGTGLLIGLVIAAFLAYCNATASAQLAATYPMSGGTYVYGREELGHWWGFTAGWGFVVGKTASCAAMALTFATYAVPGPWWAQRLVAVAGVLGLAALNYRGITRTAALTRVLVTATLIALTTIVVGIAVGGEASTAQPRRLARPGYRRPLRNAPSRRAAVLRLRRLRPHRHHGRRGPRPAAHHPPRHPDRPGRHRGRLRPRRRRRTRSPPAPTGSPPPAAPLTEAVTAAGSPGLAPVVRIGGALASLGALLALIAGVGRTSLAMARNHDLPHWLAAVHPRYQIPHHADAALAVVVSVLVLTTDLRSVIGFSSFGVLVYYLIANLSAARQSAEHRRWPRALNLVGAVGCVVLVATLPLPSVITGLAMFALGLLGRLVVLRVRQ